MAWRRKSPDLNLTLEEIEYLEEICRSTSIPETAARRAFMLLAYDKGRPTAEIARTLRTQRAVVDRCIAGAVRCEVAAADEDSRMKGRFGVPTREAEQWVCEVAGQHPNVFGYSCDVWNKLLLARHVRLNCRSAGYPSLARLGCKAIWNLLPYNASIAE